MNNMPKRGNKKRVAIAICVFIIGLLIIAMPLLWNWLLKVAITSGIIIAIIGASLYSKSEKKLSKSLLLRCKKCGEIIKITSLERPLRIRCPKCGAEATLQLPKGERKIKGEAKRQNVVTAIEELLRRESNFFVDDIKSCLSKNDIVGAERLLKEKKRLYERFLELRKIMRDVDDKTTKLSSRLAEGELSPDTYELAMDELKRKKHDIDEDMWEIQRKIFREKYEKPF